MKKSKKIYIIILFTLIIIILLIYFIGFRNIKKEKQKDNEPNTTSNSNKIVFNEKEIELINVIKEKIVSQYVDMDNVEKFEILSMHLCGYYESSKNYQYFQVNYSVVCKDGTYDCDNLPYFHEGQVFNFFVKFDINNFEDIEYFRGISSSINSDWVQESGRLE